MTHRDKGNYAAKHGNTPAPGEELLVEVKAAAIDGRMPCPAAFSIAAKLAAVPEEVGRAVDFSEIRISRCQIGLFGYGKGVKMIKPAESVQGDLEGEIKAALVDGRITCKKIWAIADARKIPRIDAACACEKLGVKISDCQLGAF